MDERESRSRLKKKSDNEEKIIQTDRLLKKKYRRQTAGKIKNKKEKTITIKST